MFNKKITWIICTVISIFFAFSAYKLFPKAFPILNISLDMSRTDALEKAATLSKKFNLGPEQSFQVATFGVDHDAQNYIELDEGGSSEFIKILDNHNYEAYTWDVRQYKPGEVNELWITFTPSGEIYGFNEILSEDLFLESLTTNKAIQLAIAESKEHWNIDLTNYEIVEKSQDVKPSERIDHTFVYKRSDISIGDEG